ncbi:MAG: alpha/beta hydrolase, partial [Thermoanaerobaculia bacterium]
MNKTISAHLNIDDTIADLLKHRAFAGFGRLILPWDDRRYDETMRLRDIGSLPPYHSHVDPAIVVASLNRMIDDRSDGRTIFYDFYTTAEKRAEPSLEST